MDRLRIGVIGHVEHITLGRVSQIPSPGEIVHLEAPRWFPGGGGGVAFFQLLKSDAEVHLFTAVGSDEAGAHVEARLREADARVHIARRPGPHTRDVVMIGPEGERTIVVVGQPLHPRAEDPLPWSELGDLDAVYFTAQDPEILRRARRARRLVATARRRAAIDASQAVLDAVLGSVADPKEWGARSTYARPPAALVMTEGSKGGSVETDAGVQRFHAPTVERVSGGAYGAGDSFAGAFVYYFAAGLEAKDAAARAAPFGAAVLAGLDTIAAQATIPRCSPSDFEGA